MADSILPGLTEATSWANGDLLYLVNDPAGTPLDKKIAVNNILQNITTAMNTSLIKSTTGYSLTGSNASSMIDLAGTLNTTGSPAIIKVAMTNTASGATTKFLSFLAGASGTTEVLSVDKDGVLGLSPTFTISAGTQIGYFKSAGTTYWLMATNGGEVFGMGSGGTLGWSSGTQASQLSSCDLRLLRDAANTLALRNGANAQAFNIYNTYTDASNYERLGISWASNAVSIVAQNAGTGTKRNINIQGTGGTGTWQFDGSANRNLAFINGAGPNYSFRIIGDNTASGGDAEMTFGSGGIVEWTSNAYAHLGNKDTRLIRSGVSVLGLRNASTGGAALETFEMTAPSAPAANGVRIYAQDNGAGKTQLMALFASGAAQQIAIEP